LGSQAGRRAVATDAAHRAKTTRAPAGDHASSGIRVALPPPDDQRPGRCRGDVCRGVAGRGALPWRLEAARLEEDIFHLAASQPRAVRSLTVESCRILARQFRVRVEERAAMASARIGRSRACPFDLHSLPVPATVLELSPTHPEALAWLSQHWGLTDNPRQVAERPLATTGRRLPSGHRVIGYSFFTAGETPDAAVAQLRLRWPALRFRLKPRPLD
jgi:hypothetical protein